MFPGAARNSYQATDVPTRGPGDWCGGTDKIPLSRGKETNFPAETRIVVQAASTRLARNSERPVLVMLPERWTGPEAWTRVPKPT
jgi:hypothetical protein